MSDESQNSATTRLGQDNRILLISHLGCPPPYEGANARIAALIQEFHRLGYEVHFAGIRMTEREMANTRPLIDYWVGNFTRQLPPPIKVSAWSVIKRKTRSLRHRLKRSTHRLLHRLEWVQDGLDDQFYEPWLEEARDLQRRSHYPRVLVPYVFYSKFLQAFPDPCLRILDTIDVFSNRRQRLRAQGIRNYWLSYAPRHEKRGLLRANRVIAIQNHEAAYFQRLLGRASCIYTVGHLGEISGIPHARGSTPRIGCIGSSHQSNVEGFQWFIRKVWPRIREHMAGAEFWVAGTLGEKCAPAPGVRILGPVPDLSDIYRDCPVFINPMHSGTGLKIKIVEALFHGRPVVTTRLGAEGLESFVEHGLFIGDTAEEFASAVVALLSNLSAAQQAGERALRQAQIYTSDNHQALAQVFNQALSSAGVPTIAHDPKNPV